MQTLPQKIKEQWRLWPTESWRHSFRDQRTAKKINFNFLLEVFVNHLYFRNLFFLLWFYNFNNGFVTVEQYKYPVHTGIWAFIIVRFTFKYWLMYICSSNFPLKISSYVGIYVFYSFCPMIYLHSNKCLWYNNISIHFVQLLPSLFRFLMVFLYLSFILYLNTHFLSSI